VRIQRLHGARVEVNSLDAPPLIAGILEPWHNGIATLMPFEAAIVADVAPPVWPYGSAIRAATEAGKHGYRTVCMHATQGLTRDLDQHDRAIRHGDRPLGEAQAAGYFRNITHILSAFSESIQDYHTRSPGTLSGVSLIKWNSVWP
jgi:hypothetical protein